MSNKFVTLRGSDIDINNLGIDKPAVIEFFSYSSGASHIMSPCFEDLAGRYAGKAMFYRVDIELFPDKVREFEVASVPCYLFVLERHIVDRLYGVSPKKELEKKLKDIIANSP